MAFTNKIPTKVIVQGNPEIGKRFIGYAHAQVQELERFMKHRDLKTCKREISPVPGIQVSCASCFSQRELVIKVIPPTAKVEEAEKSFCWCTCTYASGIIVGITVQDPVAEYGHEDVRYDVAVCHGKESYVLYTNCVPSDFAEYQTGDLVIVYLKTFLEADCCDAEPVIKESACNADLPTPGDTTPIFVIVPFFVEELEAKFGKVLQEAISHDHLIGRTVLTEADMITLEGMVTYK